MGSKILGITGLTGKIRSESDLIIQVMDSRFKSKLFGDNGVLSKLFSIILGA